MKSKPRGGSTHWNSRELAAKLGDVSFASVQRIWRKHGLRPHRLDIHMVSNDEDFEAKAAKVIGLYLDPPEHAVVFCVDGKTAIQALDRKDRQLLLSPERAQSHGFEYKRNGTLSLFAALLEVPGPACDKRLHGVTLGSANVSPVLLRRRCGVPSGRFHRSCNHSDAADPNGPGRWVA